MPRKRSRSTVAQAAPSRRDVVREALGRGIKSPTKIVEYARAEHGLHITPGHVSTLKGLLKKEGRAKGRPGRKPRGSRRAVARPARVASGGGGLTTADLLTLAGLAERAGGAERLKGFLDALERLR